MPDTESRKTVQSSTDLISIVVPVYNVEEYLNQCIDSILVQTYQKLEIILVDDGSTDGSGMVCDKYAAKDSRIKVIHQKNRGLSGARTAGQEIAHGTYITFIDSDDWVCPDMIETLYNAIREYGGDISCTGFFAAYEDGTCVQYSKVKTVETMDHVQALECYLFDEYINVCVWGKLWLTALWDGIRCPEGKLFEDQYTTYRLLERAEKVVLVPGEKYYYRKRAGSIGHTAFNERTYDLYYGIQEQYTYITQKYPQIAETIALGRIKWEIVFFNMMLMSQKSDRDKLRSSRQFARAHTWGILKSGYVDRVRKVQMLLFGYFFWGYKRTYLRYKKNHLL